MTPMAFDQSCRHKWRTVDIKVGRAKLPLSRFLWLVGGSAGASPSLPDTDR